MKLILYAMALMTCLLNYIMLIHEATITTVNSFCCILDIRH